MGVCVQVHLCEAEGLVEFLEEDTPPLSDDKSSVLVAVKQLRADAATTARSLHFTAIHQLCTYSSIYLFVHMNKSHTNTVHIMHDRAK